MGSIPDALLRVVPEFYEGNNSNRPSQAVSKVARCCALFVFLFVAYRPHVTPRTRDESRASVSRKSVLFEPGDMMRAVCRLFSRVEDLRIHE